MVFPNLRAEMARKGATVADLAQACNCSQASVYRWMHGDSGGFSLEQCKRIAELFPGVTLEYLFDVKGGDESGQDSDAAAGG